jgi:hypothetical protein
MTKCVISRTYGKNETQGSLFVLFGYELLFSCKTLELPDLGNQHNVSCIPIGCYTVEKYNDPNKGMCFLLENVPGRTEIEIHAGTFAAGEKVNTRGCILVGSYFEDINGDGNLDICESRKTLDRLLQILPDEFKLIII